MPWVPLRASADLPAFIEHFRDQNFKCSLSGTVRMETPVIYFYSPRETNVSVDVSFAQGVITEWYPHATSTENSDAAGRIHWQQIRLMPGAPAEFPAAAENHYFAARATAAVPLRVPTPGGYQDEKFLFYRGVSSAVLPLSARLTPDGRVLVRNNGSGDVAGLMLIESRGGKVGWHAAGPLRGEMLLDPPPLAPNDGSMYRDLENMLVARGLFLDEARAMIATWQDAWFEEGSRLLYIVPVESVNAILPLSIQPPAASTVRVFVGRLELLTPATRDAVARALESHNRAALDPYRRFLAPVINSLIADAQADPGRVRALQHDLEGAYVDACRSPLQ